MVQGCWARAWKVRGRHWVAPSLRGDQADDRLLTFVEDRNLLFVQKLPVHARA